MLKVTYTDTGLYLEHLSQPIEEWLALRVILAVRAGRRLIVEQGTASLLFPYSLLQTTLQLSNRLERDTHAVDAETGWLSITKCDADYGEISLAGTWISSGHDSEGVFVTALHPYTEGLLLYWWQASLAETTPGCSGYRPRL